MESKNAICVKKFGGTSLNSIEQIQSIAQRISEDRAKGELPVIVASAMSGETNRLVTMAESIFPGFRGPDYDMLLASGEQVSISLLSMSLNSLGVKAKPFLAYQLSILTDSLFSKARIQKIETKRLLDFIDDGGIPIVAGFQGVDADRNITTLGRGGSDTSAVALAYALKSSVCEIYTDMPAVYSADPRLVPKASGISELNFEEMMEMASLGCRILNIRSVELASKFQVCIHVRSSFERQEGTWILPKVRSRMETPSVTAVTHERATIVVKLFPLPLGTEILASLFEELAQKGVVVDIITQSHRKGKQRVAFSIPTEDKITVCQIAKEFHKEAQIEILDNVSKVSVVGMGMRSHPGVAARFFRSLSELNISIHLITTSEIKISAIIDQKHLKKAINHLHSAFQLDKDQNLIKLVDDHSKTHLNESDNKVLL